VDGNDLLSRLTEIRATDSTAIFKALQSRHRRALLNSDGTLFLIAADHGARGVLAAGGDPMAMADRGELLRRLILALGHPRVDGVLATPDLVEDLALLGALDDRVVFGTMNRGGLAGATFELDDRFTSYDAQAIAEAGLTGGKMMLRVDPTAAGTLHTLVGCAAAINGLADRGLPAMVEVFGADPGPDALIHAIAIASGLGRTSASTWLKLPVVDDMERVMRSTSLPTLLLGGDPADPRATFVAWEAAMRITQVRGLVAGRTLLYPADGDVERAVDAAARMISTRIRA
jgi:hypothetical protein